MPGAAKYVGMDGRDPVKAIRLRQRELDGIETFGLDGRRLACAASRFGVSGRGLCNLDVCKFGIAVERGTISLHGYLLRLTRGWRAMRSHSVLP
jgi:hypothetical protein